MSTTHPRIGEFRHRITIQRRTVTDGPFGPTETWSDVETRWAKIETLNAYARAAYQQLSSVATHRVTFRGRVELSMADYRLVWRGQILCLVEPPIDPDGRGRWTAVAVAPE